MIGTNQLEIILSPTENEKINAKIQRFVDDLSSKKQSASYYSKNRNTSAEKALNDIFLGKKAEYITAIGLNKFHSLEYIEPDLQIRTGKNKGWAVDLPYNLYDKYIPNMHVKSCNAKTFKFCNDFSWTFQLSNKSGKNGKDSIFTDGGNDLISLVYLDDHLSNKGYIKAILPWNTIYPKLRDPIKPTLIGLKKCLYYKDLC